ncbi:hypothetical protein RUND412_005603 [Rhizina undulata]
MDLYAFGFNAHSQLLHSTASIPPPDINTPTLIASGASIRVLFAGWSETLLELDSRLYLHCASRPPTPLAYDGPPITRAFGDHTGLHGVISSDGSIHRFSRTPPKLTRDGTASLACVNGVSETAIVSRDNTILHLSSASGSSEIRLHLPPPETITSIASTATSFLLLTSSGVPQTFGSPRHLHLGRAPTPSTPASEPHPVAALEGLSFRKVAAGGWYSGALSTSNDLYVWGGRPGDDIIAPLSALPPGEVALVDLGEGEDVVDFGVGDGHVVALTSAGEVWTVGRAGNGQTGREATGEFLAEWGRVRGPWEEEVKGEVREVVAGGWGSFVVVERGV